MNQRIRPSPGYTAWLFQRFSEGNLTLTHGDAHSSNFLLPKAGRGALLIDWQSPPWIWKSGLGVSDVAYLMVRYWHASQTVNLAMPLLEHYHRILQQGGVQAYSWDDLLVDFHSSCLFNLYIVIEEAMRTDPRKWYPQLVNLLLVLHHFRCVEILR